MSINSQNYENIEHIFIDGGSQDDTLKIINAFSKREKIVISEPDNGIYDAFNKGIAQASGEIIGFLNSDDMYESNLIVSRVMKEFLNGPKIDVVYGDIVMVDRDDVSKVSRKWKAGVFEKSKLKNGWMQPHPSTFVTAGKIRSVGKFSLTETISADYDFLLRVWQNPGTRYKYIPACLVVMRNGGVSTRNLVSFWVKTKQDYRIMRRNKIAPIRGLLGKKMRKLPQILTRLI